ncbi:hypothetical protein ACNKHX_06125 [Shigella flexneri]
MLFAGGLLAVVGINGFVLLAQDADAFNPLMKLVAVSSCARMNNFVESPVLVDLPAAGGLLPIATGDGDLS